MRRRQHHLFRTTTAWERNAPATLSFSTKIPQQECLCHISFQPCFEQNESFQLKRFFPISFRLFRNSILQLLVSSSVYSVYSVVKNLFSNPCSSESSVVQIFSC